MWLINYYRALIFDPVNFYIDISKDYKVRWYFDDDSVSSSELTGKMLAQHIKQNIKMNFSDLQMIIPRNKKDIYLVFNMKKLNKMCFHEIEEANELDKVL
jgi:hypothetical protein